MSSNLAKNYPFSNFIKKFLVINELVALSLLLPFGCLYIFDEENHFVPILIVFLCISIGLQFFFWAMALLSLQKNIIKNPVSI